MDGMKLTLTQPFWHTSGEPVANCDCYGNRTDNAAGTTQMATVAQQELDRANRDPFAASRMAYLATDRSLPDDNVSDRDDQHDHLMTKAERALKVAGSSDPGKAVELHQKIAEGHDKAFILATKAGDARAAQAHKTASNWHRHAAGLLGAASGESNGAPNDEATTNALTDLHEFAQILNDTQTRRQVMNEAEMERRDTLDLPGWDWQAISEAQSPLAANRRAAQREEQDMEFIRTHGIDSDDVQGPVFNSAADLPETPLESPSLSEVLTRDFHRTLALNNKTIDGMTVSNLKAEGSNADYIISPGGHSRRSGGGSNVMDAGRDDNDAGDGADPTEDIDEYAGTRMRKIIAKPEGSGGPGGGGAALLGKRSGSSGRGSTGGSNVDALDRFLPKFQPDEDAHSLSSLDSFAGDVLSQEEVSRLNAKKLGLNEADAGDTLDLPQQDHAYWQSVVNEQRDTGTRPR